MLEGLLNNIFGLYTREQIMRCEALIGAYKKRNDVLLREMIKKAKDLRVLREIVSKRETKINELVDTIGKLDNKNVELKKELEELKFKYAKRVKRRTK